MIPKIFEGLGVRTYVPKGSGSVSPGSIKQFTSITNIPDRYNAMIPSLPAGSGIDSSLILRGHSRSVMSVALSPSNHLLASTSKDNTIRLWDAASGAAIATLTGHSSVVWSSVFSPDGKMLASGSGDKTIKLWDIEWRAEIATLKGHLSSVHSVSFSPSGTHLVSGSADNTIRLWDVKSRTSVGIMKGHAHDVISVAFSPDGKTIASGSYDCTARLWDVTTGVNFATLNGHSDIVTSVAFSPSGEELASGSIDKTIRLWRVPTGAYTATIKGHTEAVHSIAFSPDGRYLASGSYDNTVRVWDVPSRSHLSVLKDHSSGVYCVAFFLDSTRLASGSSDKTVRVWNVSSEEMSTVGGVRSASEPIEFIRSMTDNPQDETIAFSTPVTSKNDTFDSASLAGSTPNSQRDAVTSPTTSFPLKNDITGSVSLEGGRSIGFGGFGELFLGVHKDHGKVALKKPRRLPDEDLIRRFLREVDLWCSVTHPHILPFLGMCRVGPDVYVVSPFIKNGDLSSCIGRGMELDRSKLLFEVAEALTHLHHRGIVHGDVKAQNILLADDGSALLCDFGLAKAFDKMVTSTGSVGIGSVRWMAPELFMGEGRSMASDVYSLGITIAEVLSGRAPYEDLSESLAVMFHVVYSDGRPPKEPLTSPEGKSYKTLWETAENCWVKDPEARPHMAQVLGMLFPITREIS